MVLIYRCDRCKSESESSSHLIEVSITSQREEYMKLNSYKYSLPVNKNICSNCATRVCELLEPLPLTEKT